MVNKPKQIGTAAESAVVKVLAARNFPSAERSALHGTLDRGDITGTPGLAWEVKGGKMAASASDTDIDNWMAELEREIANSGAQHGFLIVKRKGISEHRAALWHAYLTVQTLLELGGCSSTRASRRERIPTISNYRDIRIGDRPCRLILSDLCWLLADAGYGEPVLNWKVWTEMIDR